MAFFTSLRGHGVGLVEIFRNPFGREWRDLQRYADPIDGLRGYLIAGDIYLWGSLPLHRDVRGLLRPAIDRRAGAWLGIQINPRLSCCLVSECVCHDGTPVELHDFEAPLRASMPLERLLGAGFAVRRLAGESEIERLRPNARARLAAG